MTEPSVRDESSFWQWLPVGIESATTELRLEWIFAGDERIRAPFFFDEVRRLKHSGIPSRFSSESALESLATRDCLHPSLFIFHASRCGSTLITQLLATADKHLVFSEPPVLEQALAIARADRERGLSCLRAVLRALGQRRNQDEQALVIKLDSWHIHDLPLIEDAFPGVPMLYLYRQPAEILASHRRERGLQMVPGLLPAEVLGVDSRDFHPADLDAFAIAVLTQFFRSANQHAERGRLALVNYEQLPDFVWTEMPKRYSLALSAADVQSMQARSGRHSKDPLDPIRRADAAIDDLTERAEFADLQHEYAKLESRRLA